MKKSELKAIIRECIEEIELDEKWKRSEEDEFASGDSEVYNHPKYGKKRLKMKCLKAKAVFFLLLAIRRFDSVFIALRLRRKFTI